MAAWWAAGGTTTRCQKGPPVETEFSTLTVIHSGHASRVLGTTWQVSIAWRLPRAQELGIPHLALLTRLIQYKVDTPWECGSGDGKCWQHRNVSREWQVKIPALCGSHHVLYLWVLAPSTRLWTSLHSSLTCHCQGPSR